MFYNSYNKNLITYSIFYITFEKKNRIVYYSIRNNIMAKFFLQK